MPTIQVPTAFGEVEVFVHDSDRILIQARNDSPVVINRVPVAFRLHLERASISGHRAEIGSTGWTFAETSWTVHPEDWRKWNQYPSESVRTKVRNILIPTVIDTLSENPDLFEDGEREVLERDLSSKAGRVVELRNQLEQAIADADEAEQRLNDFNRTAVTA